MESQVHHHPPFWRSRTALVLLVMSGVALFFLMEEHRAHILGLLPYLIFLSCPLMHLFMHHGHHHHGHGSPSDSPKGTDNRSEGE